MILPELPAAWKRTLGQRVEAPLARVRAALRREHEQGHEVLPPGALVFRALELTPPTRVRAVIMGQDPYPTPGHAEGLCFSVAPGVKPPVSLRNIFRELHDDLGCGTPADGHLAGWARQGVLLLNAVLTVRAGDAGSHRGIGWEGFTDEVVRAVARKRNRVVFILWGNDAQARVHLSGTAAERHAIVTGSHPSWFSAKRGFFGSRPFSRTNALLQEAGRDPIDWCLV